MTMFSLDPEPAASAQTVIGVHAPELHVDPAPHACPQEPQLLESVCRLAQELVPQSV
jgi:hypothetical protein